MLASRGRLDGINWDSTSASFIFRMLHNKQPAKKCKNARCPQSAWKGHVANQIKFLGTKRYLTQHFCASCFCYTCRTFKAEQILFHFSSSSTSVLRSGRTTFSPPGHTGSCTQITETRNMHSYSLASQLTPSLTYTHSLCLSLTLSHPLLAHFHLADSFSLSTLPHFLHILILNLFPDPFLFLH